MSRHSLPLVFVSAFAAVPASAQQYASPRVYSQQVEQQAPVHYAAARQRQMGGGFIEFLFNGTGEARRSRGNTRSRSTSIRVPDSLTRPSLRAVPRSAISKPL